jgi:hypothetical protein
LKPEEVHETLREALSLAACREIIANLPGLFDGLGEPGSEKAPKRPRIDHGNDTKAAQSLRPLDDECGPGDLNKLLRKLVLLGVLARRPLPGSSNPNITMSSALAVVAMTVLGQLPSPNVEPWQRWELIVGEFVAFRINGVRLLLGDKATLWDVVSPFYSVTGTSKDVRTSKDDPNAEKPGRPSGEGLDPRAGVPSLNPARFNKDVGLIRDRLSIVPLNLRRPHCALLHNQVQYNAGSRKVDVNVLRGLKECGAAVVLNGPKAEFADIFVMLEKG